AGQSAGLGLEAGQGAAGLRGKVLASGSEARFSKGVLTTLGSCSYLPLASVVSSANRRRWKLR
ncbi:MAG: hypothetical protein ACREWE_08955, partial [Gammaproteobacteria bacterium]